MNNEAIKEVIKAVIIFAIFSGSIFGLQLFHEKAQKEAVNRTISLERGDPIELVNLPNEDFQKKMNSCDLRFIASAIESDGVAYFIQVSRCPPDIDIPGLNDNSVRVAVIDSRTVRKKFE